MTRKQIMLMEVSLSFAGLPFLEYATHVASNNGINRKDCQPKACKKNSHIGG